MPLPDHTDTHTAHEMDQKQAQPLDPKALTYARDSYGFFNECHATNDAQFVSFPKELISHDAITMIHAADPDQ
jgi:hypothetical protein